MAVSRALRRLLLIRELQEEQGRLALESALGELHRLENCLGAAIDRDRRGRQLVVASTRTGELSDRLAGLAEARIGHNSAALLLPRISAAEEEAAELRQAFLSQRVDRRQAETLIQEIEVREAIVSARRNQQKLDDSHRERRPRIGYDAATEREHLLKSAPGRTPDSRDETDDEKTLEDIECQNRRSS